MFVCFVYVLLCVVVWCFWLCVLRVSALLCIGCLGAAFVGHCVMMCGVVD